MQYYSRRQAGRVPCEVPVRIEVEDTPVMFVSLVDISRTGLRLRIPGSVLRVHRLSSLVHVARNLSETLGETFEAELNYQQLGPLIRKTLRTVRIAKRDWESVDIEIGCTIDPQVTDLEASLLKIELPPFGVDVPTGEVDLKTAMAPAPTVEDGSLVAYITAADDRGTEPLVARKVDLTCGMAFLSVDDEDCGPLMQMDVTTLVEALDKAYGSSITLRIANGAQDLWIGPAEIKEVNTPDWPPYALHLGVAFEHELRADELLRLGLPAPA